MTLYEATILCIEQETTIENLTALTERIDVMFLVGEKFEFEEYIELSNIVATKIAQIKEMENPSQTEEPVDPSGENESSTSENVEDDSSNEESNTGA